MTARFADSAGPSSAPFGRQRRGPVVRTVATWRKRKILGLLVMRDLKVRYADSILGYVWSILDPLLMAMIYWFVFTAIFPRSVGEDPYILYLLAGMLPFRWFQNTITAAPRAIKGERLVRTTALPREIWVFRLVFSKGMEYLFALPVLAAFIIGYRKAVNWEIVLMLPAMVIETVLLVGLTLLLSALGALARDVDRVMHIVARLMFYATPIIYGLNDVLENDRVPEFLKIVYYINPMTGIVSMYRAGLFPDQLYVVTIMSSAAGSVLVLAVGWWVFARLEATVLKEI